VAILDSACTSADDDAVLVHVHLRMASRELSFLHRDQRLFASLLFPFD
jgi:hypothetical protein